MRSTARRRTLSEEDRAAWAAFARRVAVMPGQVVPPLPETPAPPEPAPPPPGRPPSNRPAAHLAIGQDPGGLDRASWHRLSRGRLPPERRLDLHGRTAQSAFHALQTFLRTAHADGVRCVEIITGRGSGVEGGVLRRELPAWLNLPALRPLVLAAAHPHAANAGAVRLLLRRPR